VDVKTFNRKRIILGIAFAPAVMLVCFVLAGIFMHLKGPTVEEVQEYHDQRIKADREAYEAENDEK
jgi:hypothetical protein